MSRTGDIGAPSNLLEDYQKVEISCHIAQECNMGKFKSPQHHLCTSLIDKNGDLQVLGAGPLPPYRGRCNFPPWCTIALNTPQLCKNLPINMNINAIIVVHKYNPPQGSPKVSSRYPNISWRSSHSSQPLE